MASTRKARVPIEEQIRLINECRQSGMTDADWCRENDIVASTFYNWISHWHNPWNSPSYDYYIGYRQKLFSWDRLGTVPRIV